MTGILEVNDSSIWTPPGWIFNNVLEKVASEVETVDKAFSEELLDALGPGKGYLNFREIKLENFQLFFGGAERSLLRVKEDGIAAFQDESFYQSLVIELENILSMMRSDPRTEKKNDS